MKITGLQVIVTRPGRNFCLIRLETDVPGLYGVGDGTLNGRELSVAALLENHLAPLLIGRDPDQVEDIWQFLFRGSYWRGGPVQVAAVSAVDMALWDIKGKVAGLPLYSLLGGRCRRGAVCYRHASGGDFPELEDNVHKLMAEGYKVIRCQCAIPGCAGTYGSHGSFGGPGARSLGERLPLEETWEPRPYLATVPAMFAHIRETVGYDIDLFHDVHERLMPIQAAQLAKELEPFKLLFLEDPLRPEHKESFRLIRQHTTTPLGMGELFTNKWDALPLITEQLIDYIRCGLTHAGGITECRKIAAIAEAYHVRTAWHGPPDLAPIAHAASVHLDLAIPNFGVQETVLFPPETHEVISGMPTFEDGYLNVSDAPGLGCDIDLEKAARYPYQRDYLPVSRRADGSVQDW